MEDEARRAPVAKPAIRNFKICLFGEARSGKSLLTSFIARERIDEMANTSEDVLEDSKAVLGESTQAEIASSYQATWGLKCH